MTSRVDDRNEAIIRLLAARGAARLVHPGGTLLAHLQRTARRLERWGAPPDLVSVGLCHAAYGTHGFPQALFELGERSLWRELLGEHAEAALYAYCAFDRQFGFSAAGEVRDRFTGACWVMPHWLRREWAELTAANELDVAQDGSLGAPSLHAIGELLLSLEPQLSQAAWSDVTQAPCTRGLGLHARESSVDPDLAYRDYGSEGASVVLWHGGASPELTWARQTSLADDAKVRVRVPYRRGCPPSAPASHQDWERDARDLLRIAPGAVHVVAHSYGGVSALVAAARAPQRVRSLTVIEAPLWFVAEDDPEVQRLAALSRAFASGGDGARAEFLALAGLPLDHPETARVERLSRGFRDPAEAVIDVRPIVSAHIPVAIVSGVHQPALERLCDALAERTGGQRWRLPGAGHAPQRLPEFNARLCALFAQG